MFVERLVTSKFASTLLERTLRALLLIKKTMLQQQLKILMQMTFLGQKFLLLLS
ncbi:hypothetical protein MTR67_045344 [Solanum verrucosum]|uniref:Uncharacterized protein n=1 Tax=Solanum verrucosum TaxID=315347 RepID=A0AAF0UV35_SOLVR|nr:hypothetical protein MTR67_045344 [Solanum verrucosum]